MLTFITNGWKRTSYVTSMIGKLVQMHAVTILSQKKTDSASAKRLLKVFEWQVCANCWQNRSMYMAILPFLIDFICWTHLYGSGHAWSESEKLCQDPLESSFGKQRMWGRYNDKASVEAFLEGTVSLRVQGSVAAQPKRGNCSCGDQEANNDIVNDTPLPKRRRRNK